MPLAASHTPPPPISSSGRDPASSDELDPELLALPDPPKQGRLLAVVVLAVTALASVAMALALRRDVAYAFAADVPLDLGDLGGVKVEQLDANRLVRGRAMLGAAGALRYERPFDSGSYRVAPVVGRPDVWVELRVPAGAESGRFVPPQEFTGRLVPFAATGPKHRGLARSISGSTGRVVPEGAWLLVDGDRPAGARWAVALVALFLGFAVWNVAAVARLVRRVRE